MKKTVLRIDNVFRYDHIYSSYALSHAKDINQVKVENLKIWKKKKKKKKKKRKEKNATPENANGRNLGYTRLMPSLRRQKENKKGQPGGPSRHFFRRSGIKKEKSMGKRSLVYPNQDKEKFFLEFTRLQWNYTSDKRMRHACTRIILVFAGQCLAYFLCITENNAFILFHLHLLVVMHMFRKRGRAENVVVKMRRGG